MSGEQSRTVVGPWEYTQHAVDYKVEAPKGYKQLDGPKARLAVYEPTFGYASKGGQLTTSGPVIGNKFVQPEIRQFRPKFAYKKPELNFQRGQAKTKAPENVYQGPVIEQKWDAPKVDLYKPRA